LRSVRRLRERTRAAARVRMMREMVLPMVLS